MVLKVLTAPPTEGIEISGALIFFTIPLPMGGLPITEAQTNSAAVILSILFLCLYLTHGLTAKGGLKRQLVAEWIVEKCDGMVRTNMGEYFMGFAPFIAGILGLSALSSLSSLLGLFPPTSDMNIVAGWAILVFALITYYKFKAGPVHYLKSFAEPVPFLLPMNLISEVATPVSMAFRHYGNILSGSIISVLLAAAFAGLSNLLLGWLPGVLGEFPFLRIGVPAVLSLYFDIFSGALQAFIFATLTMMYVSGGFPQALFEARKAKRAAKKKAKQVNAAQAE
ncbi:MAG: F0F1 ATP synthase subunit A [Ruminococcaceae bacterium]|nr:F0F1 ATP synthase subunit A [Oscillospiraceae bacterium]